MVFINDKLRLDRDVKYSPWPNYVMLEEYIVLDIDTGPGDDRDAKWQWTIDTHWIRLS